MVAARTVVEEPDDLQAEVPVFEDSVGQQAPEFTRAGDEHPLEADARSPAALEELAHEFARAEGEQDVDCEKQRPHELRDFEDADLLQLVAEIVGLEIQGSPHAEHHGDDAADEDREEVVDQ